MDGGQMLKALLKALLFALALMGGFAPHHFESSAK
jgi:hypothetical protein